MGRARLMKRTALILAVAFLLLPAQVRADGGSFRDPDEEPGCETKDPCDDSDYMDFRRVTFGHADASEQLRHGLETRRRWKTKRLGGRYGTTLAFDFNLDGDRRQERQLRIRRRDGQLRAGMFRGERWHKRVRGDVRVWRPDRRSVKVQFHVRLLRNGIASYRWRAVWWPRYAGCISTCGFDVAPGRGWFRHEL